MGTAPPHFVILLWQHFCYYKLHKVKLGVTLVVPLAAFGILYAALFILPALGFLLPSSVEDCGARPIREEWSSSLPEMLAGLHDVYAASFQERQALHGGPEAALTFKENVHSRLLTWTTEPLGGCICNRQTYLKTAICQWLVGHVYYYPNTEKMSDKVMDAFRGRLVELRQFVDFTSAQYNETVASQNTGGNPAGKKMIALALATQLVSGCSVPVADRIKGFPDAAAATAAAAELVDADWKAQDKADIGPGSRRFSEIRLWALLHFESASETDVAYALRFHQQALRDSSNRLHNLQILLDEAVIEVEAETGQRPDFALLTSELPSVCRKMINPQIYSVILHFLLPFVAVFSFLLPPANFLEQTLIEKSLKMREFLYIHGVGRVSLKLSWIFFFLLFLVPLSAYFVVLVFKALPGGALGQTGFALPLCVLVAFNVAHLMMCQALASFLQKPNRTGLLIGFMAVFAWIFTCFTFQAQRVVRTRVWVARLCCMHPVVPLCLALIYICAWEEAWVGLTPELLFRSPRLNDAFGGVGECLCWFAFDIILYFVLSWYFEHLFPGEFGARQPFYFPLNPRFWFPKMADDYNPELEKGGDEAKIEPVPGDLKPGIVLKELTKHYNRSKVGVNKLTLNFYQEEITAFLGQNGAGKSTTMNTLVGLIAPTKGEAHVKGMDIRNNMSGIRKILGFVPQYDILYPGMTVEEHLQFFGWLKGLSRLGTLAEATPLLTRMGLNYNLRTPCTALSGGQQRKLSVITAYLNSPQVVILDEPTSGVDPFSRRHIWDLILSQKANTTTILSTHFMDEADILGDRVSVISTGRLVCSGTPMFLKTRYSRGFRLDVHLRGPSQDVSVFVAKEVPGSTLFETSGDDVAFALPHEFANSPPMISFLQHLERDKAALGVLNYGITEPTMEDVFFAAVEEGTARQAGTKPSDKAQPKPDEEKSTDIAYTKSGNIGIFFAQFYVLSLKKIRGTLLSPAALLMQVFLPISFLLLFLLIGSPNAGTAEEVANTETPLPPTLFLLSASDLAGPDLLEALKAPSTDPSPLSMDTSPCRNCVRLGSPQCEAANAAEYPSGPSGLFRLPSAAPPELWVRAANSSKRSIAGGFAIYDNRPRADRFKDILGQIDLDGVWPASDWQTKALKSIRSRRVIIYHAAALRKGLINEWHNTLLQSAGSSLRIRARMSAVNLFTELGVGPLLGEEMLLDAVRIMFASFFVVLCFLFATFGPAVFVQAETASGLKRLQLFSGVWSSVYWLTTWLWDLAIFAATTAIVALLLTRVSSTLSSAAPNLLICMTCYGFMAIPSIYFLTFLFKKPTGMIVFSLTVFLFFYLVGMAMFSIELLGMMCDASNALIEQRIQEGGQIPDSLSIEECGTGFSFLAFSYLLLKIFVPSILLAKFTLVVCMDAVYKSVVDSMAEAMGRDTALFNGTVQMIGLGFPHSSGEGGLFRWEALGRDMCVTVGVGVAFLLAVLALEYYDQRLRCACCRRRPEAAPNPFRIVDSDVNAEKDRVFAGAAKGENLVIQELSKTYRGRSTPAVAGVSVGVPPSQCFGLLGINGAGKTSLFRLLTSFEDATGGLATLGGRNLLRKKAGWGRFQDASYCPQENTLFPTLTPHQHLALFAAAKGIPRAAASRIIECLVREVGLSTHVGKRAGQLSGGNQRKVQFAMALLGYPKVIFLDEPSSGMDPGARRDAWACVHRAKAAGSSVVLTSHSMEECEALCGRLVIMVAGSFQCIGSLQYLKGKFGNKYSFKLKLIASGDEATAEKVKAFVSSRHPAMLLEQHRTLLQYEVSSAGLELSRLFETLSECRRLFAVEDFTVSQTTLEHIFVGMAKLQEKQRDGFVVDLSREAQAFQVAEAQRLAGAPPALEPPPAYSALVVVEAPPPPIAANALDMTAAAETRVEALLRTQSALLTELGRSGFDELPQASLERLVDQSQRLEAILEERAGEQGLRVERPSKIPRHDTYVKRRKSLANFSLLKPERTREDTD